ncbi:Double zinc ribbon [Natronincola peptidivorans]|uniref:Double zinc ribbon n=1 Tax=Natronincola peptidivorans TaxID=426128 RepID=A0A1I0BFU7_9FIRM|nr:zinc ribbon domain-containing protein [Natronincola peptidivorans]SET05371.1 Double zinc ribbon [Natronincola peptidivorans]
MPILACIGLSIIVYILLLSSIENTKTKQSETIHCSQCNEKIDPAQTKCPSCKEMLKAPCNDCQKMIYTNWRYCPYCGDTKEERG